MVSVPYKAMHVIVKERLVLVVEERKLVAEEQGGFRKGMGCRDQILYLRNLMLLWIIRNILLLVDFSS